MLGAPVASSDARAASLKLGLAKNLISAAAELQRPARLTKISRSDNSLSPKPLGRKPLPAPKEREWGAGEGGAVPDDLRRTLEQGRGGEPNSESERAEAGRKKVRNKQEVFNYTTLSHSRQARHTHTGADWVLAQTRSI